MTEEEQFEEKQFDKQIPKEGKQTATGLYYGVAEPPKSGIGKNNKEWRKVKINFLLEGKSKPNRFLIWTPINLGEYKSEDELTQFNEYTIEWYEKAQEYNKKEWVDKTIVSIMPPNKKTETNPTTTPPQQQTSTIKLPEVDSDKIRMVAEVYLKKISAPDYEREFFDVNHWIGTYIKYAMKDSNLIKELEYMFDSVVLKK
jgi:hypothetical protein